MRIFFVSLMLISTGALAGSKILFPKALNCQVRSCKDVNRPVNTHSWCDGEMGRKIIFELDLDKGTVKVTNANESESSEGTISTNENKSKAVLDFSDGDQYAYYDFSVKDLVGLRQKKVKQIKGIYTDAFDWADGYHVRYKSFLLCQ
ncbi:MAG: hypothetical protein FJ116_00530 [Deltaproteobacteria bacterium]|nr:hypothetical protein [Deltaproteobacteria bacterium]MBM4315947.1 hypothetical protein [Deltaproteobacteria bacterium]